MTAPAHIVPPVFEQIVNDDELTGRHLRVWRAALRYLDLVDPKELKLDVLERDVGIDRANLSRLVGRLVERGYLVRLGRAPRGGAWRYRVPLARHAGGSIPDVPAAASTLPEGERAVRRMRSVGI